MDEFRARLREVEPYGKLQLGMTILSLGTLCFVWGILILLWGRGLSLPVAFTSQTVGVIFLAVGIVALGTFGRKTLRNMKIEKALIKAAEGLSEMGIARCVENQTMAEWAYVLVRTKQMNWLDMKAMVVVCNWEDGVDRVAEFVEDRHDDLLALMKSPRVGVRYWTRVKAGNPVPFPPLNFSVEELGWLAAAMSGFPRAAGELARLRDAGDAHAGAILKQARERAISLYSAIEAG